MTSAIYLTIIAFATLVLYSVLSNKQLTIAEGNFTKDTTSIFKGVAIMMIVMGMKDSSCHSRVPSRLLVQ